MDQYIVSARKYRPSTFQSVVGQKALVATLKNAIATNRLAHSYLFCGSRGVGKTSCARIFAKTINCEHPTAEGEACNECDSCRAFNQGNSLNIIELDAASNNGVDDIRALVDQVQIPPSTGRYRVFIVDEVHMLSAAAFNAFLKTLEEPPHYVIFILATTEKQKIIPTILSRCQIYDFARITVRDMVEHLQYVAGQEGFKAEPAALSVIARKADGAMRDALSIFDQVAASTRGDITYQATIDNLNVLDHNYYNRLIEDVINNDVMDTWLTYKEIRDRGFDSHFFINGFADYLRDLMVARSPQTMVLLETDDEARKAMAAEAVKLAPEFIYRAMDLLNDADLRYRDAANKQFLVELTLAKLCQIVHPLPIAQSVERRAERHESGERRAESPESGVRPGESGEPRVESVQGVPRRAPAPPKIHVPQGRAPRTAAMPSIHGAKAADEPSPEPERQRRDKPYTDQQIDEAWQAYIGSHGTEVALVNIMALRRPRRADDGSYVVRLTKGLEHEIVEKALPSIAEAVADAVQNDDVRITLAESEGVASPATWTEQQVLDDMIKDNPGLSQFIADFRLGLA